MLWTHLEGDDCVNAKDGGFHVGTNQVSTPVVTNFRANDQVIAGRDVEATGYRVGRQAVAGSIALPPFDSSTCSQAFAQRVQEVLVDANFVVVATGGVGRQQVRLKDVGQVLGQ